MPTYWGPDMASFNPLPSCEGRRSISLLSCGVRCFNPLPSCEGRRKGERKMTEKQEASIHFPLAREDNNRLGTSYSSIASIHFPLAREDWRSPFLYFKGNYASIHFPLAREDRKELPLQQIRGMLQSTSLLRGKTNVGRGRSGEYGASIHFPLAREDKR